MIPNANADSTVRIAHFSDIHLTAKKLGWRLRDLLTKRATGWMNMKLGRGRRFRDAPLILQAMMADIRDRGCQHLIFSGDASTLGFAEEFEVAARALHVGQEGSLPGLAVPGNHDYYTGSLFPSPLLGEENRRAAPFERYFAPWQMGERIDGHIYPFAQRVGSCWLIGVNSARPNFWLWDARGEVGAGQLARLRELLRRLSPGLRILVTHYPLFLANGESEHHWRQLRDAAQLRAIIEEGNISLWLHGHRHAGYVIPATPERPFAIVCAGSATQAEHWSWNEYEIQGTHLTMTRHTWHAEAKRFEIAVPAQTILLAGRASGGD